MIVKVCGMRDPDNIRAIEALGVDWMGFIFYRKSPRVAPDEAPDYLPAACRKVGVFVNSSIEEIVSRVRGYSLDMVQLHGNESPDFCRQLSRLLPGVDLIKAMQVRSAEDLTRASEYSGAVSWLLFDTPTAGYGG
ncbi:MAG: phosphoribosylanthranilate isomerase, partial [Bacteroidales bacterium]|nr:phosphoribosylanthranilate isomerase [Candidatus Cryptobacteroides faecihippi]